jgi:predicted porin
MRPVRWPPDGFAAGEAPRACWWRTLAGAMRKLGSIFLGPVAGLAMVGAARSADLPTVRPTAPAPSTISCFSSFYDYISASAQDCPLTWKGVTLYGQLDVGAGYSSQGADFNRYYNNGVAELIAKFSQGAKYQLVPNGLSQSNIGLRGKEEFTPGWSLIFDANASIDPYSLQISNGPRSLVENNNVPVQFQNTNADSSRAGQWDNTRGFVGLSNRAFGTLTIGRETTFSNDTVVAYDPMGGSYAFSLIGNSSTYVSGVGDSETSRYNTSVKYQVAYNYVRAGALWQFGGYGQGNGSNGAYQFDLGFDYSGFSFDAVYSYARDAVALSTYGVNPLPAGVAQDDLKATLADISGVVLAGKYDYGPIRLFGGYENARFSPPSDTYPHGFETIGGYTVLPDAVNVTNYIDNKILQVGWVGAKYAIRPDLDIAGAYYWAGQNNYTPAGAKPCAPNTIVPAPGNAPQGSNHSTCAGALQAVSGLIDWRPYPRLDIYAGAMFSEASGGIANGYLHSANFAPTAGLRLTF